MEGIRKSNQTTQDMELSILSEAFNFENIILLYVKDTHRATSILILCVGIPQHNSATNG